MTTGGLVTEPQAQRPHSSRARRAVLALAGASLLVTLDWWQANREMDQLLDAVELSEKVLEDSQRDLNNIAPQLHYRLTAERREQVLAALQRSAADAAAEVQDTGALVQEVFVLPWHRSLVKAREVYDDHSQAWDDRYSNAADDIGTLNDRAPGARITSTFRVAERAFVAAIPRLALNDAEARVAAIFEG